MTDSDDHVIPYEEAVRRHRALEEQREKGAARELKFSDAMSHLLDETESPDAGGASPQNLRRIVEREFPDEGERPDQHEHPRPHLVRDPAQDHGGQLCSFETRKCWDPDEFPEGPPD